MRSILITAAVAALSLAGCSKSETSGAGGGDVVKREAGSWKTTINIEKMEMPGMPPEMKQAMQGMMNAASKMETCLTPEAAAQEDLAQSLSKSQSNNDCTFTKKSVAGGTIDVAGTCKDKSGKAVNMVMTGKAEPKGTDVKMNISGESPMGGAMSMVMNIKSEWTGACKPGQATTGA